MSPSLPRRPALLAPWAQGLGQRFDLQALRPPEATATEASLQAVRQTAAWQALLDWCWAGAGPGHSPWWQPGAQPAVTQRLAVAALCGPDPAATRDWANALACQIDGSLLLADQPHRAAALGLRLRVKLTDAMWWRVRQRADPWDAGWARTSPQGLRQFQGRFAPRRATLVLADPRQADLLQPCLAALAARSDGLRHPLRWLWVGGEEGADDLSSPLKPTVPRFSLR